MATFPTDEAVLAAGTIVRYSLNVQTPSWVDLKGALSIGAVGFMSEAKERTTLADTNKKYGAGLKDAPDKTIKGQYYANDPDQSAFIDAADKNQTLLMQVEYPNKPDDGVGAKGSIAEFELATLGFELDDATGEDWMMFTVNGKQNSISWTAPVAGS